MRISNKQIIILDKRFTPTLATKKINPEFTPTIKNSLDLSYSHMQRMARYFSDSKFRPL